MQLHSVWPSLASVLLFCQAQDSCFKTDGAGSCCYQVDVGFDGDQSQFGAPDYKESPLHGRPLPSGSIQQPLVFGYVLDGTIYQPQHDHGRSNWGWGVRADGSPIFGFMETHQFVFPADAAHADEFRMTVRGEACGGPPLYKDPSPSYLAMWQGGRATFAGGSWLSNESLRVSYASYLAGESGSRRHRGDPLYITLIPCKDRFCEQPDSYRAVLVMVSFRAPTVRPNQPLTACQGDFDTGSGYDCCYISQSITLDASQSVIDDAVHVTSYGPSGQSVQSCIKRPYWQCFDSNFKTKGADPAAGKTAVIQFKGSLVDFILDSGRKWGQGLRIVLGDLVTLEIALSTTYIEFTVDTATQYDCDKLCLDSDGFPTQDMIESLGSLCRVTAVSSFAATNGGKLSVGGFGRIDGIGVLQKSYFQHSLGYQKSDSTPGNDCPLCNRFCPWSPYAQGMHRLTTCCYSSLSTPCPASTLLAESGDARYHIESGLLELSSSSLDGFAVDIADVTVSNPLKRGDGSVMVQSPGHFQRTAKNDGCLYGTLEEQQGKLGPPCRGPGGPARSFSLKYVAAWHDAADGPSLKSEGSHMYYTLVHNSDDCLKPYSNSLIVDSTVLHGGIGGVVTPCTYNLLGHTPGCVNTLTRNTHVVRDLDPSAGYDGRGGVVATRYCAGKSALWWSKLPPNASVSNNTISGLVVEPLGALNKVGRGVAITIDAPQNKAPVYFCSSRYDKLSLSFGAGAFTIKGWHMNGTLSSSIVGLAALISAKTSEDLEVFSGLSTLNVSGLAMPILDGLGCGYTGVFFPCLWPSSDTRALGCFLQLDSWTQPRPFWSLNSGKGPCTTWLMPVSVACEALSESQCSSQVHFLYEAPPGLNQYPESQLLPI